MIDLSRFTARIEKQREAILSRIKRLRRDDPFANTDRSLIVEPGTDAAALFGHEQMVVLEGRLKSELAEIEAALAKIKKGTYGKCERCGRPIEPARLEAKPSAIYCLADEKKMESKKR
ncbi:TraR/DksA C4-type zinc finger protein [Candidatus Curtissbacteria bacterium]|nr:TraR/DksA C4-type zinc finger protein [Candidatus Curtissbacteria bacterium]